MREMTIINKDGQSIGIDPVDVIRGQRIDEAGYLQPTYNWTAVEGYALDADGLQTGRYVFGVYDNGTTSDWVYQSDDCDTLNDYLMQWDEECIEAFRAEGLID